MPAARLLICALIAMLGGGCCSSQRNSKNLLAKRNPAFIAETTDLYEVSLDFWKKMDKNTHEDTMKMYALLKDLGFFDTEEKRQRYSELSKTLREGQERWSAIFSDIRARMDPNLDILLHYSHVDAKDSSNSNDGILIVRNGQIRDKIILNGVGSWRPPTKTSVPNH